MSYTIALNFEDGVTRLIECKPNEKVLDAAYRQRINLPMDCSDGVCGTCKCHCDEGKYDLGDDYLDEALTDEEADKGLVLTCQMVPATDCVIAVPASSTVCKTPVETQDTQITAVKALSDDCFELNLALQGDAIGFLPGQFVNLQVPGTDEWRSYSFSSAPGGNEVSFLLRNVPDGVMSHYLKEQAKAGDEIKLRGPQGSFYLRAVERPILMLAGGTGLAPMLSMLELLAERGCAQPIRLFYGVNIDDHLVKCDALDAMTERLTDFSYIPVVVDSASQSPQKGYVTDHISDDVLHDGDVDVYLCGPPPMVDAVMNYFSTKGITPHGFYYEKFVPKLAEEAA